MLDHRTAMWIINLMNSTAKAYGQLGPAKHIFAKKEDPGRLITWSGSLEPGMLLHSISL